jgi:hypothetical protein
MDALLICRGALSALGRLPAVPSTPPLGGPAQTRAALTVDPEALRKPAPPDDVYGQAVWMVIRNYRSARQIELTLNLLGGEASAASASAELPAAGRALAETAANEAAQATKMANTLNAFSAPPNSPNLPAVNAAMEILRAALASLAQAWNETGARFGAAAARATPQVCADASRQWGDFAGLARGLMKQSI